MRRFASLFFVLIVCGCLLASFAIPAQAAKNVTFSVSSAKGKKGDVIPIDISVSYGSDLGAIEFDVVVNPNVLKPVSVKDSRGRAQWFARGAAGTGGSVVCSEEQYASQGRLMFAAANADGYWYGGVFVTIYLKVVGQLPTAGAEITCDIASLTHYDDNRIAYNATVKKGRITNSPTSVPSADDDVSEPHSSPSYNHKTSSTPSIPRTSTVSTTVSKSASSKSRTSAASSRAVVSFPADFFENSMNSAAQIPSSVTSEDSSAFVDHPESTTTSIASEPAKFPAYIAIDDSDRNGSLVVWIVISLVGFVVVIPVAVGVIIYACRKLRTPQEDK